MNLVGLLFNDNVLALQTATTSKLSLIFRIVIIAIVYIIIFIALRIMYKDIKNGGRRVSKATTKKSFGLEVIEPGASNTLRSGSIIPVVKEITIGRKEDNNLVIPDSYVSGHHARIYLKNTSYVLEDLNSTNGTILNSKKIANKVYIKKGDEIKIGNTIFKVIA
ncbi:MAG: FHA domain-containing protein [Bacillota bacterium]|nr:FHA domain-containing protein [Bacillota bacterium]